MSILILWANSQDPLLSSIWKIILIVNDWKIVCPVLKSQQGNLRSVKDTKAQYSILVPYRIKMKSY